MSGDLDMNSNNILEVGTIGVTGTRVTKGWFTALEVTNEAGLTIGGTAISSIYQPLHASLTSIAGLTETNGGLLYGTADNTYAWLAAGTAGYALLGNGAAAPVWTQLDSDDLSDVASIAMLDETETVSALYTFNNGIVSDDSMRIGDGDWYGGGSNKGRLSYDDESTDEMVFEDCYVGIGQTTPTYFLDISGSAVNTMMRVRFSQPTANMPAFRFERIRTSSIVQNGDGLLYLDARGYDGSAYRTAVDIRAHVDGAPGSADMPGRLTISTTLDGEYTPTERMRIDNAGEISYGTTSNGDGHDIYNYDTAVVWCDSTVTADTDFGAILPAGYYIETILVKNTTANAIGATFCVGFSAGGQEIVADVAIGASDELSLAILQQVDDFDAADNIFVDADDWNSATLIIYIKMRQMF